MPVSAPPPLELEAAEVRYRCPKCRLEVGLMLKASVSCSRCGRAMKRLKTDVETTAEVGRAS